MSKASIQQYVIGLDIGTGSAKAVVLRAMERSLLMPKSFIQHKPRDPAIRNKIRR